MPNRSNRKACWLTCVLSVCALGSFGCRSSKAPAYDSQRLSDVQPGDELPIHTEMIQRETRIATPLRIVIYDYPSLSQFPLLNLDVDFKTQMVLLAAMGPASSRLCEIRIEGVWMGNGEIEVDVKEFYPQDDDLRSPMIVSPIHAVVVPRCELPISGFTSRIPKNIFLQ